MLKHISGNIFEIEVDAIMNPVNDGESHFEVQYYIRLL